MLTESVKEYYSLTKKNEVREAAKKLRRKFLRYKDAEIVYSMSHKTLLEHASKAGAISFDSRSSSLPGKRIMYYLMVSFSSITAMSQSR